jgi:tetratricopeptide (TPR) repeat protein
MSLFTKITRSSKVRWAALVLAFGLPVMPVYAQRDQPRREISDRVAEQMAKLRELTDNKDFAGALKLIDDLLRTAQANSYDVAVLSQVKAQVLLSENRYAESIPPLEEARRLGEQFGYFDEKQMQDLNYYLAQLHYQVATAEKEPERMRAGLDRSIVYMRNFLRGQQNNPDALLFGAHLFYNRGTINQEKPEMQFLEEALKLTEQGMVSAIRPREPFYVLTLAVKQHQGRNQEVAELLELLVKQFPTNRQYWQQLAFTYLSMAEEAKDDPERSFELNVRTILTIERAQQLGIMDEPRDHFNLIGIYFNLQRFDQAIDLLEKGLQAGNIEDTQRNWELLASSYQQVRKELKAIDVLKEAAKRFPEAGQIEFTIAQTYYTLEKMPEAYQHAVQALEKGNLDRPSTVQLFAAYIGYELGQYQEALRLAEQAAEDPNAENADRLLRVIREAMEERSTAQASR